MRKLQRNKTRRLVVEQLSPRELLAADIFETDVNADGIVSAIDALQVLNALRSDADYQSRLDVNNDNLITPVDALVVLNAISRSSSVEAADSAPDAVDDVVTIASVHRTTDASFELLSGSNLQNNAGSVIGRAVNMEASDIVPGPFGNALEFNQSGEHAVIDPTDALGALGANNADFSYSFYFRLDEEANGNFRPVLFKGSTSSVRSPGVWMFPDDNRLHVRVATTTQFNEGLDSTAELVVGQWTHIAIVKKAQSWSLYLDGQLDRTVTLNGSTIGNEGPLYLGGTPFQGGTRSAIDELEVFNRAISEQEIDLLRLQPQQAYQIAYGNVGQNDTDPENDLLQFELVDASPGGLVDLQSNGDFEFLTPQSPAPTMLFTYRAIDAAGNEDQASVSAANAAPDAVDDVVELTSVQRTTNASFEFLSGSNLQDDAGSVVGRTVNMEASDIVPGPFGNALEFNQSGEHAVIDPTDALNALGANNADFSYSFYFRLDEEANGNFRPVLFKGSTSSARSPGVWMFPDDNRLHVRVATTSQFNEGLNSTAALVVGQWTHIAIVKKAQSWSLYLDGQLDRTVTLNGSTIGNEGPLYLGGTPFQGGTRSAIDELEVFDRAISEQELDLLRSQPQQAYQIAHGNVGQNDTDPENDVLQFEHVSTSPDGSVDLQSNGDFEFLTTQRPADGRLFTYQAIDGSGNTNEADVLFSNRPPDAIDDSIALSTVNRIADTSLESVTNSLLQNKAGDIIGHVVNLNASNIIASPFGNALEFNQNGQYAAIDPTTSLNTLGANNADFSLTFFYRLDQAANGIFRPLLFKGNSESERSPGIWTYPDSNRLHVRIATSTQFNEGLNSSRELALGQWTHIAVVKQGQLWSLYLDGVLDQQVSLAGASLGNEGPLYLGGTPWKSGARGAMDEVEVFDKPLSLQEINLLKTQPQQAYLIASGNVGTNDSDPNNDPLTFELASISDNGTIDLNPDGEFEFLTTQVPTDGLLFQYKAIDSLGTEDIANVALPPVSGTGTGLVGEYFQNEDLTDRVLVRTDNVIDFDWLTDSPDPLLGNDTFSVRWTGQVEARYSETYTFETLTDDGVRLWINDQLIIDQWQNQTSTMHSGSVLLTAGQRHSIRMEYFEDQGDASAKLLWSSPSQALEVVPQTLLYEPPGVIGLQTSVISVNEDSGNAIVEVARQLGTDGTITVDYRTFAGSATEGIDFVGQSGTLTFLPGETTQHVIIPIANDTDQEANENFAFTIDNVVGGATLLFPRTATITIVDDDTLLPFYSDFADATGLSLNGDAEIIESRLRLTSGASDQTGIASYNSPVTIDANSSFQTEFEFQITGGSSAADRIAFVLQNTDVGELATGNEEPSNSLVIELSASQDPGGNDDNHVSVLQNGSDWTSIFSASVPLDLNDGIVKKAWIDYNGTANQLAVYIASQTAKPSEPLLVTNIDLYSLVGSQTFLGFTAATSETSNPHDVLNWQYATTTPTIPTLQSGGSLSDITVANGLAYPTAIDWSDEGQNLLIAQKNGVVRVARNGTLLSVPFINLSSEVNNRADRGLLDIAVHPDFATNPYVYLAYTYDPIEVFNNTGLAGPDGQGNRAARMIRVTADPATNYTTAIPGSEVVLLGTNSTWDNFNAFVDSTFDFDEPPAGILPDGTNVQDFLASDSQSHTIGALEFGIDGALFVSVGDGASYNQVDPRAVRVQDIDNLSGKILRIDPITGRGLENNPFYNGDPDANRSKVYQYGLRNPFRMSVDPTSGQLYVGDVGWSTWEEVNAGEPGANFGWPYYEGASGESVQNAGYANLPEAQAFYASGAFVTPSIFALNHATDGINAIALGDVYSGTLYPDEYQGNVFFNDMGQGIVRNISFDALGNIETVETFATGAYAVVQIKLGPDGSLYFVDLDDGRIGRWIFL